MDTEDWPGAFDETDGCCKKDFWCGVAMRSAYHELLQLGFLLAVAWSQHVAMQAVSSHCLHDVCAVLGTSLVKSSHTAQTCPDLSLIRLHNKSLVCFYVIYTHDHSLSFISITRTFQFFRAVETPEASTYAFSYTSSASSL